MTTPEVSSPFVPSTETTGTGRPNPIVSLPVPCDSHQTPIPATPPVPHRTALRGTRIDRLLLAHCREAFVPVHPLTRVVPRTTLYLHLATLLGEGSLVQRGRTYHITADGLRRLAAAESAIDWTLLEQIYPPLQFVPTVQLRAVIELILTAVAPASPGFGRITTRRLSCLAIRWPGRPPWRGLCAGCWGSPQPRILSISRPRRDSLSGCGAMREET